MIWIGIWKNSIQSNLGFLKGNTIVKMLSSNFFALLNQMYVQELTQTLTYAPEHVSACDFLFNHIFHHSIIYSKMSIQKQGYLQLT